MLGDIVAMVKYRVVAPKLRIRFPLSPPVTPVAQLEEANDLESL